MGEFSRKWQKKIETRKWTTNFRGDLVICSSKKPNIYPAGFAVCIAELYDIKPMIKQDEKASCCKVYPGASSWFLKNIRKFKNPIPIKGSLGIFKLELDQKMFGIKIKYHDSNHRTITA